jgi:phage shock protein A
MARYAILKRRIDELEADAEAYDLGKKRSLEDEFSDLVAENGIEDELDAIKVKLAEKHSA